jgi:hypothetical protein
VQDTRVTEEINSLKKLNEGKNKARNEYPKEKINKVEINMEMTVEQMHNWRG